MYTIIIHSNYSYKLSTFFLEKYVIFQCFLRVLYSENNTFAQSNNLQMYFEVSL